MFSACVSRNCDTNARDIKHIFDTAIDHCPESCYGTQGWIPSMLRVDSEQEQMASVFLIFVC